MHDLGTGRGHFEHLVVGNLGEFAGVFDDARIAGIDAVHIGEDLADIRLEGGCHGDGGEVRATTAQRVNHAIRGDSLEAGDDEGFPFIEETAHQRGVHVEDAAAGVGAGGADARLAAGDGGGVHALLLQSHGNEGDRLLLAGGQQYVEFAFARVFREFLGHFDEAIGDTGHGGNHGHDLVSFVTGAFHPCGDVADAVKRADGGAAVFLNDESHGLSGAE